MLTRLAVLLSRIGALFRGRSLDDDFTREIESHLAMLEHESIRRGMPPDEARRAARLAFGGSMQTLERNRDDRALPQLETTLQDLRYAWRALAHHPAFALVGILTLAIGIAAGTIVFSFVRATLLRPLPYRDPGELVRIFETNPLKGWTRNIASPANYADWKARNTSFIDIAAYEQFNDHGSGAQDVFLTGFGEPQGLKAMAVTGNLFQVLGAPPLLGRTFVDEETFDGHARVVIIGYGVWQGVFGGDPAIIGRTITLSGRATTVVGVMPREFFFPGRDVQVWTPVAYEPGLFTTARRPHWLGVVARRKPGVSLARAQEEMNAIARRLEQQYPDTNTQMGVRLEGFHDSLAFSSRTALLTLSAAVGLLFLIVCVNVANLQLGRGVARARELAIRAALGAERRRLLRQLLTEAALLSAIGGALGIALAASARLVLLRLAAAAVPLFADVRLDGGVLAFALLLSAAAPVLFAALPAVASLRSDSLSDRTGIGGRDATVLRHVLVAGEVALSIVLVVGAVLLVRSLSQLETVDPGFDQQRVVTFTLTLPSARYPTAEARLRAFDAIEQRIRQQPGVDAVGAASTLALRGFTWTGDATVEGRSATDYERELRHKAVTPGYFTAMGIRLVAGRLFDERDTRTQPPVTIVNQALAARYFGGAPVIGKRITFGRPQDHSPWVTIVGVVADEKQDGLDAPVQPQEYSPIAQRIQNPMTFVVRSPLETDAIAATARAQVHAIDGDLALTDVTTLRAVVDQSLAQTRFRTTLLSAFAGIALLLAALGIYGVLSYFVSQRSRELGVRLALGAPPATVFRLVLSRGMLPVVIGLTLGVGAAAVLTTAMHSLLFGITPVDPAAFAISIAALVGVALTACAIPAVRATRVDPVVTLRQD